MISVGDRFPEFNAEYVLLDQVKTIALKDLKAKWTVLFFYPEDFSFICPTEVTGFNDQKDRLDKQNVDIFGVSVDDIETHKAWIHELKISYPLISDLDGKLAQAVGVLDDDNRSQRATFIINPDLKVEFVMVTARNVGRSVLETIRVSEALLSGNFCPADYDPLSLKEKY